MRDIGTRGGVLACRIDPPWRSRALVSETTHPPHHHHHPPPPPLFPPRRTREHSDHVRPKLQRIAPIPRCIPAEREVFLVYYPRPVTRRQVRDGGGLGVLFIFILWRRLAEEKHRAPHTFCNSLIKAFYFFLYFGGWGGGGRRRATESHLHKLLKSWLLSWGDDVTR